MYKPIHFLIRNRKLSTGKFFIRNKELPICSNCVIKYDLAAVCRLGDSNCGKKGLHYTAKNQS